MREGVAVLGVLLVACGDDASVRPGDAGVDAAVTFFDGAIATPVEPGAVELPVFTPCPAGWGEVTDEPSGVVTCDPWAAGRPTDCPTGEAWFPGDTACAPLGNVVCPAGDFAEDLPATGVVYVLPGAPGGDGTRDSPHGRLADALAGAGAGTVIAIGKGTLDERVRLVGGQILRGACAAETILLSTETTGPAVLEVTGPLAQISDLTVGPSVLPGIRVAGATAQLEMHRVAVENTAYGILAYSGGAVTGSHVTVRRTRGERVGTYYGFGLDVEGGGSLVLDHVVSEMNEGALFAGSAGSTVHLEDAVLRGSYGSSRLYAFGALIQEGASATLRRVVVERNTEVGIHAVQAGARATLEHVVVQDAVDGPGFDLGVGVNTGGHIEGTRVVIQRARRIGLIVSNASSAAFSDLVIRDTASEPEQLEDDGVVSQQGSMVELTRVALLRNSMIGASAREPGSVLRLEHALIADTVERPDGSALGGLIARLGARTEARFVRIERNRARGALAETDGHLVLEDAVVNDTLGRSGSRFEGYGLLVDARVEARRVRFSGNREIGVRVVSDGDLTLEDATIEGTRERDCAATTCAGQGAGTALGVHSGGTARVTAAAILGSPLCGVQLHGGSTLDLGDVRVAGNAVGACVQQPYDITRLTRRAVYEDNDVAIDTRDVYFVPDAPLAD